MICAQCQHPIPSFKISTQTPYMQTKLSHPMIIRKLLVQVDPLNPGVWPPCPYGIVVVRVS